MSSQILKSPLPYIALLIAHLIWGANYVVAKITLEEIPVMSLAFLRFSLACLLLAPFFLSLTPKENSIKTKDLPRLFAMGITFITLSLAFFYLGLIKTTAIDASTLALIVPILSVLAGWWFFKEKIFLINLFGIFISLAGALVVLGLPLIFLGKFSSTNLVGNILILLSGVCSVIGFILAKEMLKTYHILVITGISFLVGVATFLVPAGTEYLKNPNWVSNITLLGVLGLAYITILSTISAFFLLEWALKKIPLSQANLVQYIEPAVAATLAVSILGERISYSFIIGSCLIVLGVYWGTLGKLEHHHLHHRHHRS